MTRQMYTIYHHINHNDYNIMSIGLCSRLATNADMQLLRKAPSPLEMGSDISVVAVSAKGNFDPACTLIIVRHPTRVRCEARHAHDIVYHDVI